MSMQELERFHNDLSANESLREKIQAAGASAEEQIAAANANGYQFTKEDVATAASGEISDQDLEQVAGGSPVLIPGEPFDPLPPFRPQFDEWARELAKKWGL